MLWDRYYKVDKNHRRSTVGAGLGLSIVKGVLEAHGAEYGVAAPWARAAISGSGCRCCRPMPL